jgi:hypothetical protein
MQARQEGNACVWTRRKTLDVKQCLGVLKQMFQRQAGVLLSRRRSYAQPLAVVQLAASTNDCNASSSAFSESRTHLRTALSLGPQRSW